MNDTAAPHGHDPAAMATGPMEPVPVHVPKPVATKDLGADYGAWATYVLAAATAAQKILPHDEQRRRAVIIVSGTGPVWVGTQAQCQASPPVGGQLATGAVIETKNRQELWLAPAGASATVTVLTERWGT